MRKYFKLNENDKRMNQNFRDAAVVDKWLQ